MSFAEAGPRSLFPAHSKIYNKPNSNFYLCRHSLVVIVFLSMSRQMGHISSLCKLRGDTAISVLSVITSCGVLCSSYKLNSHVLFDIGACSITIMFNSEQISQQVTVNHKFTRTFPHKRHPKPQFPVPVDDYRKHDRQKKQQNRKPKTVKDVAS